MCEALESGSVRPDGADLVIPILVTGEGDLVPDRRPGGEVVAGGAGLQFRRRSRLRVEDDQVARLASRGAIDQTLTIRCPAWEAAVALSVRQHLEATSVRPDDGDIRDRRALKRLEESAETERDLVSLRRPNRGHRAFLGVREQDRAMRAV